MELIDTHCHLDGDYGGTRPAEELIQEAKARGLVALVNVAVDRESIAAVAETAARYPLVYCTAGIHPHEASTVTDEVLAEIRKAAENPRCIAIGETGLDYYYEHSPREQQRVAHRQQLEIARELRLPVVIHTRDAESDQLDLLRDHVAKIPRAADGSAAWLPGIIHCFTGTREFGEACLELGFYISFSGILTFKNAEALRDCARNFPLDRILVETDSPFLAPIPHRGKKGEPAFVLHTAEKLAEVRGIPLEEVARATTANARRVFRF